MQFDFSHPELYNEAFLPLFHSDKRYKILYGGRDSGKSDHIAITGFIVEMLRAEFFRGILLRKYYRGIKESQFQTIIDYINLYGLSEYFQINISPLQIINRLNTNNVIFARGLDQPDNTKSIKDPTCIWYEEAEQISKESFMESGLSLRSSRDVRITEWLSFNPKREQSWINSYFFPNKNSYETEDGNFHYIKSIRNDAIIMHSTYKDNRFCPKLRRQHLESFKDIDLNYYKVNTLGLWGNALKGLIYPAWKECYELPVGGDEVFGLDYGYNNPTALIQATFKDKELYIKQLIHQSHLTHSDVVEYLNIYKNTIGKKLIVVDSAEPSLIEILRRAGFNAIPSAKGPDSVYQGIMLCKRIPLNITTDSTETIAEYQGYVWKTNQDGNPIDEPVKIDDHSCDAVRYVVQTYGVRNWFKTDTVAPNRDYKRPVKQNRFSNY